ncbi:hypothetical protein EXIGLDRAFT_727791 [Exidia glandulosa HHB12029]|uniref:F-box domain-containing protein n=1 Tax=Exidia glandulosa HHB12029 TaxID=1314781 RepID=A0A165D7D6_EXIGL|nr:hypothetical protein EXIGLDRAFT_727791 [Exidia glandulosa HHB12029]
MRRLHLEAEWFEALSDGRNLSCSLAPLGPSCRLRELVLLRTIISDFTVLPATLTRFAYGDPSCSRVAHLTLLELEIILRTCPALKFLWLSVSMDLPPSGDDIDISPHPQLQLEELSLGWTDATITQHLLDSLSVRSMRYVDVGDCETDPVHGVLQGIEGHAMSIFPSTSIINGGNRDQPCNLRVSDSSGRIRSVREADFMLVRQYETLWSHLVSLTIYNDADEGDWDFTRPPPDMPCLEFLRVLYDPSSSWELSDRIEILEPWGRRSYDYDDDDGGWNCPSLHTVEFAPAAYRDGRSSDYDDAGSSHYIVKFAPAVASQGPNIIPIRPRHILAFVTRELASAPVSRVILKGDGIRLESDEELELPFSLSYDPSDRTIHAVDRYGLFPFNGFHSE